MRRSKSGFREVSFELLVFEIGDVEIGELETDALETGALEIDLEFALISFSNEKLPTDLSLDFFRGALFLAEPIFRLRGVFSGTWGTSLAISSTVVAESHEWTKVTEAIDFIQMPPR